jgi:hypothetical protein
MLREPLASDEPIALVIRGHFAHGNLALEAGHHRLRQRDKSAVARVVLAPLANRTTSVEFSEQRPLKSVGQLGGKVRSRIKIVGSRLVLQNGRNLSENRELARDIAPSWPSDEPASPPRVRRYDLDPFHVRDYLTGSEFSRKDILGQKAFHRLLCERVGCASGTNKGELD